MHVAMHDGERKTVIIEKTSRSSDKETYKYFGVYSGSANEHLNQ